VQRELFIPALLGIASAIWFVLTLNDHTLRGIFSGDMLYLPALAKDLLLRQSIQGWNLPGAPYLFPDLLFVTFLEAAGVNFRVTMVLLAVIQCVLCFVLLGALLARTCNRALTILSLGSLAVLTAYESSALVRSSYFYFRPFALTGNHFAAFLGALAIVCWYLRASTAPRVSSQLILFLVTALFTASDRYFVIAAVLPLLLSSRTLGEERQMILRKFGPILAGTVVGFALARLVSRHVESTGSIWLLSYYRTMPVQQAIEAAAQALLRDLQLSPLTGFAFALSILSAAAGLILSFGPKLDSEKRFVLRFSSLAAIFIFLAPIITATYQPGAYRYIVAGLFLLFLTAPLVVCVLGRSPASAVPALVPFGILILLIASRSHFNGPLRLSLFSEPITKCLDRSPLPLKHGVADFWFSKVVTLFSQKGISVLAVDQQLRPAKFVANSRWYSETERFDFVVTTDLDRAVIEERLGAAKQRFTCGGHRIWVYPDGFTLERPVPHGP